MKITGTEIGQNIFRMFRNQYLVVNMWERQPQSYNSLRNKLNEEMIKLLFEKHESTFPEHKISSSLLMMTGPTNSKLSNCSNWNFQDTHSSEPFLQNEKKKNLTRPESFPWFTLETSLVKKNAFMHEINLLFNKK